MIIGNEVVFWSLGIFIAFILILMLLIKFWVGRCNEFDQNGLFENDVEDTNYNKDGFGKEITQSTIYFKEEKIISSSKEKMRNFQQQISLQ